MPGDPLIRPIREGDRDLWAPMWRDYLSFYDTVLSDDLFEAQWARLMSADPASVFCALAWDGDRAVGMVHWLFHVHGWKTVQVCYLQDLYALPDARGRGVGRALIEHVYAAADARGCPDVYWMTTADNYGARRLYDRIGVHTPFVKYARR